MASTVVRRVTVSAPSKLILFGEHAIVSPYSQLGVAAAVQGIRTEVSLTRSPADVPLLSISSSYDGVSPMSFDLDASLLPPLLPHVNFPTPKPISTTLSTPPLFDLDRLTMIQSYLSTENLTDEFAFTSTLYLLSSLFGLTLPDSLSFEVDSHVPESGGLGSSASFAVALTGSLLALFDETTNDSSSYDDDFVEATGLWSHLLECICHGTPSGLDDSTCTLGGFVRIEGGVIDSINVSEEKRDKLRLLIVDSGVSRDTMSIVKGVRRVYDQDGVAALKIMESIGRISNKFLKMCDSNGEFKIEQFDELIRLNQELLSSYGSGLLLHPKLEEIFSIASSYDLASKLTGAGGGGCAIISMGSVEEGGKVERELIGELEQSGFGLMWAGELGGERGVRIDQLECF